MNEEKLKGSLQNADTETRRISSSFLPNLLTLRIQDLGSFLHGTWPGALSYFGGATCLQ